MSGTDVPPPASADPAGCPCGTPYDVSVAGWRDRSPGQKETVIFTKPCGHPWPAALSFFFQRER